MQIIDDKLLNKVCKLADESPRQRMNYNFHPQESDPFNRLLNAMNPGTQFPVHRHVNPDKDESFLVLRGSLVTYLFDEDGNLICEKEINPKKGIYGMDIPAGVWHTFVVQEPGTVVYEAKQGPYAPVTQENIAPWQLSDKI
ncbi:MAG: WbuC family cupin fold metalloprotein [Dysgonamonadaceae bacterium]|nr:WbuC family cupin fold metalloprotein [Dysgonamonadaceae bacterium]